MLEYSRYISQKYWLIKFNNSQPVLKWNTQLNQGCLKELFEIAREIHMNHFTWFSCSNCLKIVWTFTWISREIISRENHMKFFSWISLHKNFTLIACEFNTNLNVKSRGALSREFTWGTFGCVYANLFKCLLSIRYFLVDCICQYGVAELL